MRILILSRDSAEDNKDIVGDSFKTLTSGGQPVEVEVIRYLEIAETQGWDILWRTVIERNRETKPNVIYFQYYHGGVYDSPVACIRECRRDNPGVLVFGSCGDPFHFGWWCRLPHKSLVDLASVADAFFCTHGGWMARYLLRNGARNYVVHPNAYCDTQFKKGNVGVEPNKFDVVMSANAAMSFRPGYFLNAVIRCSQRRSQARILYNEFGERFGLFGSGWQGHPASRGWLEFNNQLAVYRSSRIVVDAHPPIREPYYTSDRVFFMLGSGVPLIQYSQPRLDKIFKDGEHCYYVCSSRDLPAVCKKIFETPEEELKRRSEQTLRLLADRHTPEKRSDTIISVAEALIAFRKGEISLEESKRHLRLWHFLPDVDMEDEINYAVEGWVG